MTCQEFVDFILAYLERDLGEAERTTFEAHVGLCPPCLDYLETYKDTVALGIACCAEPEGPVPDDVPEQLVQAVLSARRAQS